jgi:hypothetical protein
MIESMLRRGCSEREIADALRGDDAWDHDSGARIAFSPWIRAIFGR